MIWFTDASALVKRYINEKGSQWFRQELSRHHLAIAQITQVEMIAAIVRRYRQGNISEFALFRARRRFLSHYADQQYEVVEMSAKIVEEAQRMAFDHGLKAYDAVQLATAVAAAKSVERRRFAFVVSDIQLETAGRAEGLQIENPLNH